MEDEEMEEFALEDFVEGEEIDMEYEFDAPKFFDFTRFETHWEAEEAEDWFQFAASYPSSPFILRLLNWHKGNSPAETATSSLGVEDVESISCVGNGSNGMAAEVFSIEDDSYRGENCSSKMDQDTPRAKTMSSMKSPTLSRSSSLMKPTASHLAKQIQRHREVRQPHCSRISRRDEKKLGKSAGSSLSSPLFDILATKRQKLEAGYMSKVSQLKHQPLWSHKSPKKSGAGLTTPNSRTKVTIPREPNLQTAQRAQQRTRLRKKENNRKKIFKEPSWNSTPQEKEFQVFHFRTSQRAKHSTVDTVINTPVSSCLSPTEATEIKGAKSAFPKSDQSKLFNLRKKTLSTNEGTGFLPNIKQEGQPSLRELKFPTDKTFMKEPPTDLFSKLSLAPESHHNSKPDKTAYAC